MNREPIAALNSIQAQVATGLFVRVDMLADGLFRLRYGKQPSFSEPALNRYGILRNSWEPVACEMVQDDQSLLCKTHRYQLRIQLADGQFALAKRDGSTLARSSAAPEVEEAGGFRAAMQLCETEKLYGFGDTTRDRIQMRGFRAEMWIKNVASYMPIPWLMSSRGWGLFVNTTWRHVIDAGESRPDVLAFEGRQGDLDFYLFAEESPSGLLGLYTDLTGKPALLPAWAYGFTFVCNTLENARDMLENGFRFRQCGLPCDVIGMEPGWMEEHYDLSLDKKWHPGRFYLPDWAKSGPDTFLSAAKRMGFNISMWLCCDYDLLFEAERRVRKEQTASPSEKLASPHPDDFEKDEHFDAQIRMDKLTRPGEAWFEHLKKFVDQGITAFKLDGAYQVCEHPDRRWGAGMGRMEMCDEQMHNLYPLLYNQQMAVGFKEHTGGRRPMVYSAGGYAGIQQFSATWAGDTGGGPKPLVSLLNLGLSGHSNTTVDMHVFSIEGIHFGFLQPWSQLNSWAYWRHPWLLGDTLGPVFKFYSLFRSRLMPYIYSFAHVAAQTGVPVLRAMPLMFPDDPASDALLAQYMLGDAFLVGAFEKNFHLPPGRWIDFWTGERRNGPMDWEYQIPPERGGPLFLREGAIVPLRQEMDYWNQKPMEKIELHVVPSPSRAGRFVLVEDDGVTLDYQNGVVCRTAFSCIEENNTVTLKIGAREGSYKGVPAIRHYTILLYLEEAPTSLRSSEQEPLSTEWDATRKVLKVEWTQTKEGKSLECFLSRK